MKPVRRNTELKKDRGKTKKEEGAMNNNKNGGVDHDDESVS